MLKLPYERPHFFPPMDIIVDFSHVHMKHLHIITIASLKNMSQPVYICCPLYLAM